MKGVPPEIDSILWRLAEEENPVARTEFEARHPRYGPELARRVAMVAALRSAGKAVAQRPAFTPRPVRALVPRGLVWATAALGALAVGTVAYVATLGDDAPPPRTVARTTEAPRTPSVRPSASPAPAPETVVPPPAREPTTRQEPAPVPDAVPPEQRTSIRIEDKPLTVAIGLIAQVGRLDVTVAPGFQNRNVTLDYRDLTPLEILRTMGEEYEFTVIEEGENAYLLVPVRERQGERRIGT